MKCMKKLSDLLILMMISSVLAGITGCSTVGYYSQALSGQVDVLSRRESIEMLVDDPKTNEELRHRLANIVKAREFAVNTLHLPDSASFTSYADVGRPFVIWNVFATPELSLKQKQWCHIFIGCFSYRSYFSEDGARTYADELEQEGYDVYVGGVAAYSTLGWFEDPVYNTMMRYSDTEMAGILFHELAHEVIYVDDDTAFNESFAMAVQLEGTRKWLEHINEPEAFKAYKQDQQRDEEFVSYIMQYRKQLEKMYALDISDEARRKGKTEIFKALRENYKQLKASWNGYKGYDNWFKRKLNNATLAPIGTYHHYVPAFVALLKKQGGNFTRFYEAANEIARMPKKKREQTMKLLVKVPTD